MSRGDLVYPDEHEQKVREVVTRAALASLNEETRNRGLRILEVGMGKDCRLIRRGLYDDALSQLAKEGVSNVKIYGIDVSTPSERVYEDATLHLQKTVAGLGMETGLDILKASITEPLEIPAEYFDAVICSLTLCSVNDQDAAITAIKRLIRKNGGTFGFVEHVAVNSEEPYRLLALQQEVLDPLQQAVADNCHLHRFTDGNIAEIFGTEEANPTSRFILRDRFLVDGMWPVSCQASGVIQVKG